jgi:RNA polymerase sigma-70 factor (ECF subfamily)
MSEGRAEHPLSAAFVSALAKVRSSSVEADNGLEAKLTGLLHRAVQGWPGLGCAPLGFMAHLGQKVGEGNEAMEVALGRVHVGDLYLAYGCLSGAAGALEAFERMYLSDVPLLAARRSVTASELSDVQQILRERLFVGSAEKPPKISDYSGRGSLRNWMHASLLRALDRLRENQQRETLTESVRLLERAGPREEDPELKHLKDEYRDEFKAAFVAALRSLEPKERNLLRQRFIDELSLEQLAKLHQVNRVTISRWLAQIRSGVLSQVREALKGRLGLDTQGVNSILRLLRSQFDVSIRRYLVSAPAR